MTPNHAERFSALDRALRLDADSDRVVGYAYGPRTYSAEGFESAAGWIPVPSEDFTGECYCGCGVLFIDGVQVSPVYDTEALPEGVDLVPEVDADRLRASLDSSSAQADTD